MTSRRMPRGATALNSRSPVRRLIKFWRRRRRRRRRWRRRLCVLRRRRRRGRRRRCVCRRRQHRFRRPSFCRVRLRRRALLIDSMRPLCSTSTTTTTTTTTAATSTTTIQCWRRRRRRRRYSRSTRTALSCHRKFDCVSLRFYSSMRVEKTVATILNDSGEQASVSEALATPQALLAQMIRIVEQALSSLGIAALSEPATLRSIVYV